jgi:hypothetical protein
MRPAPAAYDVWVVLPTQFLYVQLTVKDGRRRARIGFTLETA